MKLFLVTLFVGIAAAGQLTNNYLPPQHSSTSGGHGNFLQGPHGGGAGSFGHGGGGGSFGHGGGGSGSYGGGSYHGSGQHIPILKYENVNNGDGSYHFDYATGNGITQHEQGHNHNDEQVVSGAYSYTGDDGHVYTVSYKADGNGFQPVGDHLPTPPPIPEEILKSLAYNAAHPEEDNAGAYNHGGAGSYNHGGAGSYNHGGSSSGGGSYSHGGSSPQQNYLPPHGRPSNGGYHY